MQMLCLLKAENIRNIGVSLIEVVKSPQLCIRKVAFYLKPSIGQFVVNLGLAFKSG